MNNIKSNLIKQREEYISIIRAELLGPGSEMLQPDIEHEIITARPDRRYSVGILFPRDNKLGADNDDTIDIKDVPDASEAADENEESEERESEANYEREYSDPEEENLDEEMSLAAQNKPSSMGLTFFVKGGCDKVKCRVSFATYKNIKVPQCIYPLQHDLPDDFDIPVPLGLAMKYDKGKKAFVLAQPLTSKAVADAKKSGQIPDNYSWLSDVAYKLANQLKRGYIREPHSEEVLLEFGGEDYIDKNREICGTKAKLTALRHKVSENVFSLTIVLVNDEAGIANGRNCIFQPEIIIRSEDNSFTFFDYRNSIERKYRDKEELALAMQYRKKNVFGTGLGTSVDWNIDSQGSGTLYTEFFPVYEVPAMDFSLPSEYGVEKRTLSMRYLSDLEDNDKSSVLSDLGAFAGAYKAWISEMEKEAGLLSQKTAVFKEPADEAVDNCKFSLARMEKGIEILRENKTAWDSFRLANRAMFMQRVQLSIQQEFSNKDRYPDDPELTVKLNSIDYSQSEDRHFWRPFQLAFLLMSLEGITDDKCPDRELVDLIWFPTGGGKTEAYLGLTAFTIFYRRMAHKPDSGGTAVIMRYTLRLLAAQQFTRAATLICACEYIRRDSEKRKPKYRQYDLGTQDISIGLWIGREHTPNKNKGSGGAKDHLDYLIQSRESNLKYNKERHNKFQVLKCPWCGTKLVKDVYIPEGKKKGITVGEWGYRMKNGSHFRLNCTQEDCPFNDELPIQIVDDELYLNPPALLFGTVDKFAMLPWKKEIGSFFAEGSANRAPELIIQDELHLISGPLGTMVGLYETAIDELSSAKGIKPKIVASTATIRRAKEQCSALYNRLVRQFPAPGINSEDSFFAREMAIDHDRGKFGRTYIGLMPAGKTKAMMEDRSIAALLQAAYDMEMSCDERDKFWTLTVYFNSLRDLGKCSTLVDDEVTEFMRSKAKRLGSVQDVRKIGHADELTSRVSTTELNETLDKLEKLAYSEENINRKKYASNVLLATNMISVGIDVSRLNVMLLVGQPKLTSEYIQASSRVGREYPGMVFAMYDGSKSRDRSHYEQFISYHQSFYRYVEPTVATPFSKPARARALHAVIVSCLRHRIKELSGEKDAINFDKDKYNEQIKDLTEYIIKREEEISNRLDENFDPESDETRDEIYSFLDNWDEQIKLLASEETFQYGESYLIKNPEKNQKRLMKVFNSDMEDITARDTMTSMRNIDTAVRGNVLIWEE